MSRPDIGPAVRGRGLILDDEIGTETPNTLILPENLFDRILQLAIIILLACLTIVAVVLLDRSDDVIRIERPPAVTVPEGQTV
jgi:hypothetical protein